MEALLISVVYDWNSVVEVEEGDDRLEGCPVTVHIKPARIVMVRYEVSKHIWLAECILSRLVEIMNLPHCLLTHEHIF